MIRETFLRCALLLALGVCLATSGHAQPPQTPQAAKPAKASKKAAANGEFHAAMKNLGQDVAYLDQPEFKAFWDADAKRVEDAVRQIGKVEG